MASQELLNLKPTTFEYDSVQVGAIYGVLDGGFPFKVMVVESDLAIGLTMTNVSPIIKVRIVKFEDFLSGPWDEDRIQFEQTRMLILALHRFIAQRYSGSLTERVLKLNEEFIEIASFFDK